MELNHTIVPTTDKEASAKFFARMMGLSYDGPMGPFCRVLSEGLAYGSGPHEKHGDMHTGTRRDGGRCV